MAELQKRIVRKSHERIRTPVAPSTETKRTKQSFKDQCDINKIMERWNKGQNITHLNPQTPLYGDFTTSTDLQQSLDRVAEAQSRFNELPSAVRQWAQNDPVTFLELVNDPQNEEKLQELGLLPAGPEKPSSTTTRPQLDGVTPEEPGDQAKPSSPDPGDTTTK